MFQLLDLRKRRERLDSTRLDLGRIVGDREPTNRGPMDVRRGGA
jgi:hypothetical protein